MSDIDPHILFKTEPDREVFREYPGADEHICLECANLEDYGLGSKCTPHRELALKEHGTFGTYADRDSAQKIELRRCKFFALKKMDPDALAMMVKVKKKMCEMRIEGMKHYTGD